MKVDLFLPINGKRIVQLVAIARLAVAQRTHRS